MPSLQYSAGTRKFTNDTGADLDSGDLVQLPDGVVGLVDGLAGVESGKAGRCVTDVTVKVDKASATVIAAGDRIQYATATKLATAKVGAADTGNIIIGRANEAAGSGTLTVSVTLNHQGPTI